MSQNPVIPRSYRLPDLHALFPWKASINPHRKETTKASTEWILSFDVLSGEKLESSLEKNSGLLCAWAYPFAGAEQLRICCDFINLLFTENEALAVMMPN